MLFGLVCQHDAINYITTMHSIKRSIFLKSQPEDPMWDLPRDQIIVCMMDAASSYNVRLITLLINIMSELYSWHKSSKPNGSQCNDNSNTILVSHPLLCSVIANIL